MIGDTHSSALVGRDGSIDWLCLPRFDSGACFAALLGTVDHGRWLVAPVATPRRTTRRYRPGTLILETTFETTDGEVRVIDFMPPRGRTPDVVRIVEGVRGRVPMRMELLVRFDYGASVPWVRQVDGTLTAIAGPDALYLRGDIDTHGEDLSTIAEFALGAGQSAAMVLAWGPSYEPPPTAIDAHDAARDTEQWWHEWSGRCTYQGQWKEPVDTSLVVLKALTYAPTGGIVAAPTTSLPEQLGGVRNWDYRYCWLRDATFTLYSLLLAGYREEAQAWRDWLLRAAAGKPEDLQIMYGVAGERRLPELELDWLPGYQRAKPVRIGNAASRQFQLDVYGEVMDALHQARHLGIEPEPAAWSLQRQMMEFLETAWRDPDEGIWEVRGPRQHFTHSKVMAWVAADRAVRAVETSGLTGPVERWKRLRHEIHDDVCSHGYDAERNTFTQYYGSQSLDGSLLMLPLVGFLPPSDPRIRGTVDAIQRELCVDGFVLRYPTGNPDVVDGLPPGEGAFLPCTFWLVDNLALLGRNKEATMLFERLLALRNDIGLLAEEYDPVAARQVGNFPQAFTHVGLVNSVFNLSAATKPAVDRPSFETAAQ